MMSKQESKWLIVDNGSNTIKAGFAEDHVPRAIIPTVVGRPRHAGVMVGMMQHPFRTGDQAIAQRGVLQLSYPVQNGVVTNFNDMEKIWDYTFAALRNENKDYYKYYANYDNNGARSEECCVLLTESVLNPTVNREQTTQIMFETFTIPAMSLMSRCILSLYGIGKSKQLNGIVLNSGDNHTMATPVYQGRVLKEAVTTINFGGKHITQYLTHLLADKGYSFVTTAEKEIVRHIKETESYIAVDYENELKQSKIGTDIKRDIYYELPDGKIININEERFKCAEILFKPSLNKNKSNNEFKEYEGIHKLVYDSIMKCDKDIQRNMFDNIILSGGNTVFSGINERLKNEINDLVPNGTKVNIMDADHRQKLLVDGYLRKNKSNDQSVYSQIGKLICNHYYDMDELRNLVWIGGSILCSMDSFKEYVVSKADYDEIGTSVVFRKH